MTLDSLTALINSLDLEIKVSMFQLTSQTQTGICMCTHYSRVRGSSVFHTVTL